MRHVLACFIVLTLLALAGCGEGGGSRQAPVIDTPAAVDAGEDSEPVAEDPPENEPDNPPADEADDAPVDEPDDPPADEPAKEPVAITPDLDTGARTVAIVGPDGGTLEALAPNGSLLSLMIPPGALLNETEISLTPVAAVPDLPGGAELTAGAQFGPSGLLFRVPATFTVSVPDDISLGTPTGFSWTGSGQNPSLWPAFVRDRAIEFIVPHFSGVVVINGDAALIEEELRNRNAVERIVASRLAVVLEEIRGEFCGSECSSDAEISVWVELGQRADLILQWYLDAVGVLAVESALSGELLSGAMGAYVSMLGFFDVFCQLTGGEDCFTDRAEFRTFNDQIALDLARGFRSEFERNYQACVDARFLNRLLELELLQLGDEFEELFALNFGDIMQTYGCQLIIEQTSFPTTLVNGGASHPVTFRFATRSGGNLVGLRVDVRPITNSCANVAGNVPELTNDVGEVTVDISARFCGSDRTLGVIAEVVGLNEDPANSDIVFAPKVLELWARIDGASSDFTLSPDVVTLSLSQTQNFQAVLTAEADIELPRFEWRATGGTIVDGAYVAGTQPGNFQVYSTLLNTGETRMSQVTIEGQGVFIDVPVIALERGESFQFEAVPVGLNDPAVTWEATGGTITPEGVFTAGENLGDFGIEVRSAVNPDLFDQGVARVRQNFISCGIGTAEDTGLAEDQDGLYVVFDGNSCQLVPACLDRGKNACGSSEFNGNALILLDIGGINGTINWDVEAIGDTNWQVSPDADSGNEDDRYFTTVRRLTAPNAGRTFILDAKITMSQEVDRVSMEVDAQIVPYE